MMQAVTQVLQSLLIYSDTQRINTYAEKHIYIQKVRTEVSLDQKTNENEWRYVSAATASGSERVRQ